MSTTDKAVEEQKIDFAIRDYLAILIFGSEYRLIKKLLDMNARNDPAIGHLMEGVFPYIALMAYESNKWYECKSGAALFGQSAILNEKRQLFKYYDDSSYTVDEFETHCADVLNESGNFFKRGAGLYAPFAKDAGIFVQDKIPIGSTYTSFRYMYTEFHGLNPTTDKELVAEKSKSTGEIIGNFSAFLHELVRLLGGDDGIGSCSSPAVSDQDYDFYLGDLRKPLREINDGNPSDGAFVILSDAYYSLGMIEVLSRRRIADSLLTTKLTTLVLFHLKSSIDSIVAYNHRIKTKPYNDALCQSIAKVLSRENRDLLNKCVPLRNTLVHYQLPDEVVITAKTIDIAIPEFEQTLTFNTGLTWIELANEITLIGEEVCKKLESLLGIPIDNLS